MLPVVALVGRPNVGKSTLFNFLTRTRDALVADLPGPDARSPVRLRASRPGAVYRGRYGRPYWRTQDELDGLMARQTLRALDEADVVLFMVDAREGLTARDEQVAELLRRRGRPVTLVVNKAEGQSVAGGRRSSIASASAHRW
jgi:GTPase